MNLDSAQRLRLHHVGYVVPSIERSIERFTASVDGRWDGRVFEDPAQRVRVTFIEQMDGAGALIELVEPLGEDSRVKTFLARGGGLHHLCYEVDSLEEQLKRSASKGGVIVQKPVPAVAFGGRRIAWFFTREKLLLEFLERNRQAA